MATQPNAEIEPIPLDAQSDLDAIHQQLRDRLTDQIQRALKEAGPAAQQPGFAKEVENIVISHFLTQLESVVHQNITVGGLSYEDHVARLTGEVEPYDESLNRAVMLYQDEVSDAVTANVAKRKNAPVKVAQQVEQALAEVERSSQARWQSQTWTGESTVVANVPDREGVARDITDSVVVIDHLQTAVPAESQRAQRAIEVFESLKSVQQVTS